MLNVKTIAKLTEIYSDNEKFLGIIERCLKSFMLYHQSIYEMEIWIRVFGRNTDTPDYKDKFSRLDKYRTSCHNSVLGNVNMLNRLAEKNGLDAVYDGIVSEERPYRREVANAVLEYVEYIIENRR